MSVKFVNSSTDNLDVAAMIKVTEAFRKQNKNFWENAMVILTFANTWNDPTLRSAPEQALGFKKKVMEWKTEVHQVLESQAGLSKEDANKVRVVPASHHLHDTRLTWTKILAV